MAPPFVTSAPLLRLDAPTAPDDCGRSCDLERATRELAVSEARFRALAEASPLGVFHCDADGGCTYVNARWEEIYGLPFERARGDGWMRGIHPDDAGRVAARWREMVRAGGEYDQQFRVCDADGRVRHIRARARPLRGGDGAIDGFVGTVADITELQHTLQQLRESEERLRRLYECTPAMLHSIDAEGRLISVSDHWLAKLGYRREDVLGRPSIEFLTPESRRHALEVVLPEFFRAGRCDGVRYRMLKRDGGVLEVELSAILERDADGRPLRSMAVLQDITEQRRIKQELAEQHELLRVTLESIGDGVVTTDADGRVMWLNPVAERLSGWRDGEARGQPLARVLDLRDEASGVAVRDPIACCLQDGHVVASGIRLVARDGRAYGIEYSVAPIRDAQGAVLGAVLVFRDVTEQRRLAEEMNWRATHDPLTGLVNRTEFEARLGRALQQAQADGTQYALLYIDLDDFKLVNDACGHTVGDQMLQQVGRLLTSGVRASDTVARLGGDEFAIILERCTVTKAQRVAQQICDRMDDFRFAHEGRRFRIGTSIGVVPVDRRWATTAAILQAADTSCYAAKMAGRNRYHLWFDTDQAMRARQGEMHWATRIENALDEDRFVLFAQRLLPLKPDNDGIHAEALLRLRDNEGHMVPPGAFLPAAERFHLASRIDRWVLRHTVDWLKSLDDPRRLATLCINLSGQSISDRAFHQHAIELLTDAGPLVCQRLCLEITETATVTNLGDAADFMRQIRALGVQVALDDFGAGASSFGYLKALPVDALKIDGQFIRDIIDDPLDEAAVRCFVDVARVVGVKTVAEFVDRPEVLAKVREVGIDYAQGFLVHRPEPIERLLAAAVAGPV